MKLGKNAVKRFLAVVLAFVLAFEMLPVSDLISTVKAEEQYHSLTVAEKQVLLYGQNEAGEVQETENAYTIPYDSGEIQAFTPSVYVDGETAVNPGVSVSSTGVTITKDWLAGISKGSWIAVMVDANAALQEITDVTVTAAENLVYNGKEQELAVVNAPGYTVSYKMDGEDAYTTAVPKRTDAGTYTVHVKVQKPGYAAKEYTVTASILNNLSDKVTVTPCNTVYTGETFDAVTVTVTGVEGASVTYAQSEDGAAWGGYSEIVPTIKDAGTLYVKVKVTLEGYNSYESDVITATVAEAEGSNSGITVEANTGLVYSCGVAQKLLNVQTTNADDVFSYSVKTPANKKFGEWTNELPTGTDAGTYEIKVKVKRKNYKEYEFKDSYTVKIKEATPVIEFVSACPADGATMVMDLENNKFSCEANLTAVPDDLKGSVKYELELSSGCKASAKNGNVTFYGVGTIKVTATYVVDKAAESNYENSVPISFTVTIEQEDPEFTVGAEQYVDGNEVKWYKDAFVITPGEGWVIIPVGDIREDDVEKRYEKCAAISSDAYKTTADPYQITESGKYENYVFAFAKEKTDDAGAVIGYSSLSFAEVTFGVDSTNPELKGFVFEEVENNGILSFLTFGLFSNKSIKVTAAVEDVPTGVKSVAMYRGADDTNPLEVVENEDGTYSAELPAEDNKVTYDGTLRIVIEDNVGNITEEYANGNNTQDAEDWKGYILQETVVPELSEISAYYKGSVEKKAGTTVGEKVIFNAAPEFSFEVQDVNSGLASVDVTVNGAETQILIEKVGETENTQVTGLVTGVIDNNKYKFTVSAADADEDGAYTVEVHVKDNAGNESSETCVVYIDTTAPVVDAEKDFVFTTADGQLAKPDDISLTDYGYFAHTNVTVTISAEDIKADKEIASGVKTIYYRAYDVVEGKDVIKGSSNADSVSFVLPENFKGQIYAYADDMVENTCEEVHPEGSIIEKPSEHPTHASITISKAAAVGTQSNAHAAVTVADAVRDGKADGSYNYDDSQKVPLYNSDVTFNVVVEDTYSGIDQVDISVTNGSGNGTVTIDNNGNITGVPEGSSWSVVSKDVNLATKISGSFTVTGNYNDMILCVTLTDNAGNKSYDYVVFGIDKTIPTINVSYDNNAADTASNDGYYYFKANRTATITVTERNFDPAKAIITATKDGVSYPVSVSWSTIAGTGNGDDTKHIANIPYTNDGDYTFTIADTDRANNKNNGVNYGNSVAPEEFTIDKTAPVVSVSYNNNSAQNGKYFKAHRTATITVTEHNFDVNRVKITQTARLNGSSITVPSVSWSHSGDRHVGTIVYNKDGDYTFDLTMDDKAGNKCDGVNYGNSVAAKEFTVDTTITAPTITGVENGKAYKSTVIPSVSYSDINHSEATVTLIRTQMGQKNVDVTDEFIKALSKSSQGISGTFDTFAMEQGVDGIYTLTVAVKDKAGNEEKTEVTFTVNRFGSVYEFDTYLQSLLNGYVQNVNGQLIITEYNANRLLSDSLKITITRDGNPIDNVIYTVNPVMNDTVKVGSSGWYQYQYIIDPANFTEDGIYQIFISSEDVAGNKPETANYDDCAISFSVDTTAPEITNISGLEKAIINASSQDVTFQVFDAIGLKSITVYVNGVAIATFDNFEDLINFANGFTLEEGANQSIRLVIEDLAGNITDTDASEFQPGYEFNKNVTVSTNFFVRWYANKPLFWGSIGTVAAALLVIFFIILAKRRKKDEEEQKA